jgi:LPXTG-motif cell wall-anchored protein
VDAGDYNVIYQDGNGITLTPEEIAVDYTDLSPDWFQHVEAVPTTGGTVVIINTAPYSLPHAGGSGTKWYTWSGAAIMPIALALYIVHRRRRQRRGKGGECG